MLKRYHQVFGSLLIVSDAIGLIVAWFLSFYLRFYTQIVPVTKGIPPFSRYVALTVPVVFLWVGVFSYFRLYGSHRIVRRTAELGNVLKAHGAALALFVALTWIVTEYRFSRVVIGYFAALVGVYFLATRLSLRNYLRHKARREKKRAVVIVGAGSTAKAMAERIRRVPELGIEVKGYFVKNQGEGVPSNSVVLGTYSQVAQKLSTMDVQEIILALPREDAAEQEKILQSLGDTVLNIQVVPDVNDYLVLGCSVEDFDQLPVLALNQAPIDAIGKFWKRLLDLVVAFIALAVLSPVFLLLMFLVKLTSRGPIFYGQDRMSVSGSTFKMWKFRSMKVDAEKETGAVWAKQGDDRRTPIGAFIRSTSLDELPQFWNVLVGDMSLVGPRPERPEFVKQFQGKVPRYMLRHKVKAGITGWAQVNGWRGDTSLEKRIEFDLYYIRNWSLWLDLKILLLTPIKGFVHKNAY